MLRDALINFRKVFHSPHNIIKIMHIARKHRKTCWSHRGLCWLSFCWRFYHDIISATCFLIIYDDLYSINSFKLLIRFFTFLFAEQKKKLPIFGYFLKKEIYANSPLVEMSSKKTFDGIWWIHFGLDLYPNKVVLKCKYFFKERHT